MLTSTSEAPKDVAQRTFTYPLPPGMDTNETLKYIFHHCCTFGRASAAGAEETRIDNANFIKMVKKAPGLLTKRVTTQHVDVVFTKCKNRGERRLDYSRFLDALAALAAVRYPDEDPVTGFSFLLSRHIFGLLASKGEDRAGETTQQVRAELLSEPNLTEEDLALIRVREEDEASMLQTTPSPTGLAKAGQHPSPQRHTGKILVAKQKWQSKKAGNASSASDNPSKR